MFESRHDHGGGDRIALRAGTLVILDADPVGEVSDEARECFGCGHLVSE